MNPLALLLQFLKIYGLPTVIALGLGYILNNELKQAAQERADHTVILINQMTALREACSPGSTK